MKRLCLLVMLLWMPLAFAADLKPFRTNTRAVIEQAHAGQPFIMAFWSVDCAYCPEEIRHLAALVQQRPDIKLVLVSVDGDDLKSDVAKKLETLLPEGQGERWIFTGNDPDRQFFSVDRKWHGELPRTYFYDSKGGVQGRSGRVESPWLEAWARSTAR